MTAGFLIGRRLGLAAVAACAVAGVSTQAAATDVSFTLDWAFQGPQAPFLLALDRGYFEEEGLNVTIDRGYGSGDVPVKVGAGTYDIGLADINPTIKLKAENPDSDLIAVAVLYDASPLAVMSLAGYGVETPEDLEGKTLAAPEFDAGRQLFPAFVQATGIDGDSITLESGSPQLRETMLVQNRVDAITGFLTSGILSIKAAGVPEEDIILMRYPDYGVDLYSGSIITTRSWAEDNPEAVTGIIRAVVRGHIDALQDPEAAIDALVERDLLTDREIEMERMMLAFDSLIVTDHVKANGLSQVAPERMQAAIDMVRSAYGIEQPLSVKDVHTDAYLPHAEDLRLPQ